jgi:hypothetical protein
MHLEIPTKCALLKTIHFARIRVKLARRLAKAVLKISLPPILPNFGSITARVMGWGGPWCCPFTLLPPARGGFLPAGRARSLRPVALKLFHFGRMRAKLARRLAKAVWKISLPSYPLHFSY